MAFTYLKRGSVCKTDGFSMLLIGGSTTGPGYKKNHPDIWQKDEDLSKEDEKQILKSLQENDHTFDLIFTHTVPECMVKAWFPDKDLSVTNKNFRTRMAVGFLSVLAVWPFS